MEETPWQMVVRRLHAASTKVSMPDSPWSISLTLFIVFVPTLLLFFNQIFFMPWGKMAAGVLPPGDLGLPFFGVIFKLFDGTSPQDYVKAVYEKYGGISKYFALGMGGVLVCEPDLRKAVLMSEGVAFETNWPPSVLKAMGARSVIATSGEVHKTTRALLTRWLSFGFLRGFLPKVEEAVVQSVDQLLKKGSVVCFDEAKELTFGIMCQLLLSLPPGPLRKELCDLFTTWEKGLFALGTTELPWTDFGKTMKARREIIKILTQLYLARKTELAAMTNVNDMEPRDILDTFILYGNSKSGSQESGAKAGGYTEEEVCDISLNLLFAGHATTSSALAWLLYRLYWQPETVEELRAEYDGIAMAKASGEALTWEDYKKNMKLTQRVINETQRMHPISGDLFRKALKDVKVGEYVIPKGWAVRVNMSYNDHYFESPEVFDPDHFKEPPKAFTFNPFGAGIRMCPGMELARLELGIFLHHFIRRCDWAPLEPDAKPSFFPSVIPGKGYPMKVTPRSEE